MKYVKIVAAIIAGLFIIALFIPKDTTTTPASPDPNKTTPTTTSQAATEAPAPSEPAVPAKPESLPVGETYTLPGGTIKAGLMEKTTIGIMNNEPGLCSMIEATNTSKETWAINPLEFKISYPDHTQENVDITSGDKALNHVDLITGDTAAGRVCFKDDGQKGEHTIIYKPLFSTDQYRWVVNID